MRRGAEPLRSRETPSEEPRPAELRTGADWPDLRLTGPTGGGGDDPGLGARAGN